MSASVNRSLTDGVNAALRKVVANVDDVKTIATSANHFAEAARTASASNAQAIVNLDKTLSNALAQINALEARIASLEQNKSTTQ